MTAALLEIKDKTIALAILFYLQAVTNDATQDTTMFYGWQLISIGSHIYQLPFQGAQFRGVQ